MASVRLTLPRPGQPTKPRRSKRKDSGVDLVDRAYEAHRLRVDGMAWSEVARAVGYISGQVAQMAVTAYLQTAAIDRSPEQRQAALQMELDRFDVLHAALWPRALQGDIRAVLVILQISDRRVRLERLDQVANEAAKPADVTA